MHHGPTLSVPTRKELFPSVVRFRVLSWGSVGDSLFSNNAGYMAIHLIGLSTGTLILPSSPSHFRRRQQEYSRQALGGSDAKPEGRPNTSVQRQNDKTAIELFSYAVVWWSMMGLVTVLGINTGVSRRMVCLLSS
jgi:hypothetical protein